MKEHRSCSICGSSYRVSNTLIGLLCNKHYQQWKRYGEILNRTKYDSNEIIDNKNGTSSIILYNFKGKPITKALIDTSKVAIISKYKWCLDKNGYVKNSKQEYLHRVIIQEYDLYVDHINGDKLNNTLGNLRICSNTDNCKNRIVMPSNNTSGVLGVCYDKTRNKWRAEIKVDGIKLYLGRFNNKEAAIKARIDAEDKYFGNFKSKLNETYRI